MNELHKQTVFRKLNMPYMHALYVYQQVQKQLSQMHEMHVGMHEASLRYASISRSLLPYK